MFTQDTKLLIDHWPAVEEIIQAEGKLRTQLTEFLLSLKDDLHKEEWWSRDWSFNGRNDDQAYITHNNWRYNKSDYAIWIGIERFSPSVLFGKEVFPQLYVWTTINDKQFIAKMRQLFRPKKTLGSVDERKGAYIITHFLPKILQSQSSEFESIFCDRIIEFFSFYAKEEKEITDIVGPQLKGK